MHAVVIETPPATIFDALRTEQVFVSGFRWEDDFLPTGTDQWLTVHDAQGSLLFAGVEGSEGAGPQLAPLAFAEDWEHCGYDPDIRDVDDPSLPFAIDFTLEDESACAADRRRAGAASSSFGAERGKRRRPADSREPRRSAPLRSVGVAWISRFAKVGRAALCACETGS